jgi:PAS domain S-box-containing protein
MITDRMLDVVIVFDPKGSIRYATASAERLCGYSQAELLNCRAQTFVHPDDLGPAQEMVSRLLELPGTSEGIELRLRRPDGTWAIVEMLAQCVLVEEEDILGEIGLGDDDGCFIFATCRDVTERHQVRQALNERIRFEELIASLSTSFINLTSNEIDGGIEAALQAIGESVGADRSFVFLLSDDGNRISNAYEWVAEEVEPAQGLLQDLAVDRFSWWMERLKRFEPFFIPRVADLPPEAKGEREILAAIDIQSLVVVPMVHAGSLLGSVGFAAVGREEDWSERLVSLLTIFGEMLANVLARKWMDERLRSTTQHLFALIDNLQDGVLVEDDRRRIRMVNGSFYRIFRLPATTESLVGQDCAEQTAILSHLLADSQQFAARIDEVLAAMQTVVGEEIGLADGRTLERDFVPIEAEGDHFGNLWVYRDITDRKQVEQELRKAKEAAESANRAKGTFLANMTHELRTPLTSILGYAEFLRDEVANQGHDDLLPYFRTILRSGRQLLDLVNGILDFSRLEAGRIAVELSRFSVIQLVQEVVSTVDPLMKQNENVFEVAYGDDLGQMMADQMKVRQILLNLLSNAAKFTENGRIVLDVRRSVENGEGWYRFQVSDTGIGMEPEQVERIFTEFFQADETIPRRYGGSGLGLAISRRFCQMMGGRIQVRSKKEQGTTFEAFLPADVSRHVDEADMMVDEPGAS